MKVEVVKKPTKPSRSNNHWLEVKDKLGLLKPDECLRITGLAPTEMNALKQYTYRAVKAKTFTRKENGEMVLYLCNRNSTLK
jgi:hypothetical protein